MTAKTTARATPNAAVAHKIKTKTQFLRWALHNQTASKSNEWVDPVDGSRMESLRIQVGAWLCTFVWKGSELIEWGVE